MSATGAAGDIPSWVWTTTTANLPTGTIWNSPATMTSTGPWVVPSTIKPPPVYATDVYMNEEGVILDAGFAKITVPKQLLKRLQAIVEMAALAGLVLPDGEPDAK